MVEVCHLFWSRLSLSETVLLQSLFSRLKGLIGRGQLPRLHCFSVAAPDSISQVKANGLDSRAQTT